VAGKTMLAVCSSAQDCALEPRLAEGLVGTGRTEFFIPSI